MGMITRGLAALACICVLAGCGRDKLERTLELPSGYAGLPMQAWDPALLREGTAEHLFFGNLFCQDKAGHLSYTKDPRDKEFCGKVVFAIGYAFRDVRKGPGFTFRETPVFLPSADSWDNNYVETPSVAKRGDTYYLAYSAWPKLPLGNKRYQVGVAALESKDLAADLLVKGAVFKRLRKDPVIARGSDADSGFDRENAQEPSLIYDPRRDRFELYYVGIRAKQPLPPDARLNDIAQLALGRACFDKGFNKTPCSGAPENLMLLNANMPEVSFQGGRYYLVYSDLNDLRKAGAGFPYGYKKIYLRTSVDGAAWDGPAALLERPFNKVNELDGVHSASLSVTEAGAFTLVYQGWGLPQNGDCLKNGARVMLPFAAGLCRQSTLVLAEGRLPGRR